MTPHMEGKAEPSSPEFPLYLGTQGVSHLLNVYLETIITTPGGESTGVGESHGPLP